MENWLLRLQDCPGVTHELVTAREVRIREIEIPILAPAGAPRVPNLEGTGGKRLLAEAANLGHRNLEIIVITHRRNGVPTDIPEGVKWIRRAAEQGFGPAQNTYGLCFFKARGVTQNPVEAYKWFNLAAAKGGDAADDAKVNLAMVERSLKGDQIAETWVGITQKSP